MSRAAPAALRARVARGLIVLGLFMLLTQGLAVILISEYQEEGFIDQLLLDEAGRLSKQRPGEGPGGLVRYVVRGAEDMAKLPEVLRPLGPGLHEIYMDDRELHVAVQPAQGATYYLLYDATRHEERVQEFRLWLLGGIGVSIALLVWAGLWLSRRLVAQVGDLARRVEGADPAAVQELSLPSYRDAEVQTLARAFQGYTDRVVEMLRREKEFTANVSHELRTPLTTLKTSCELLLRDTGLEGKARARVTQIEAGTERMIEAIQGLLLLAREAPVENEALLLRELVEEIVAPLCPFAEERRIRLEVDVPPDLQLHINRAGLALLLSNLLKNALAHTDRGEIRIRYEDGRLTISDTGIGIAAHELPHLFERGFRGTQARAQGSGLGLAIAKQLADRFGWNIGIASREGEGSTFSIDLLAARKR